MIQDRLNLYLVDIKYIRDLHHADDRVLSVSPQIGKQHRVFVGIIVICNSRKYLVPLSHPVEKHKRMKPRADFDKILNRHGKLIGVLNYNLMIPVEDAQVRTVDLKEKKEDPPTERYYKRLCVDELSWCRKNQETIVNKANVLYSLCTKDSTYKGKNRCLDFRKLEQICDKYNSKKKI